MGIEMPAEVRWLIPIVVGDSWPEGDETALQRLGEVWKQAATDVDEAMRQAEDAVKQATSHMDGEAAEAFQKYWEKFVKGEEATLPKMKDVSEKLATACRNCAMQIEYAKLSIIIALVILAIQIAMMIASAVGTFGASTAGIVPAQMATRAGVQIVFRQLVQRLMQQVGRNLIGKLAMQVGIEVATSVATDLAVQGIQLAKGTRDSLDTSMTLDAAKSGLISGVVGAGVGAGMGKAFGEGLGDSIGRSIGRNAAEEAIIGAGSALVEGALSDEGIKGSDVLFGATSGAVSGSVSGAKSGIEGLHADIDVPTAGDLPRPSAGDAPSAPSATPSAPPSAAPSTPDAEPPPHRSSDATNMSYAAPPVEQPQHRAAPDATPASSAPPAQPQGFQQAPAAPAAGSAPAASAPAAPRAAPTGGGFAPSGGPSAATSFSASAHSTPNAPGNFGGPAPAGGGLASSGPAHSGPGPAGPMPGGPTPGGPGTGGPHPGPAHSGPVPGGSATSTPQHGSAPGGPATGASPPGPAHSSLTPGVPQHGSTPTSGGPVTGGPRPGTAPTPGNLQHGAPVPTSAQHLGGPVPGHGPSPQRTPAADAIHQAATATPLAPPPPGRGQTDAPATHSPAPAPNSPAPSHAQRPQAPQQHSAPRHQAPPPARPPSPHNQQRPHQAPPQHQQGPRPTASPHPQGPPTGPRHMASPHPSAPPGGTPHAATQMPHPPATDAATPHERPMRTPWEEHQRLRRPVALPDNLKHLQHDVKHTKAGLSLHDNNFKAYPQSAAMVAPDPHRYTVDLHGSADDVRVGDTKLSPKDLADIIRSSGDWDGKQPIRLISCQTGTKSDGFAAQLSHELGVDVVSPTKDAWVDDMGNVFASSTEFDRVRGDFSPGWPPNGDWTTFRPDGTSTRHDRPSPPGTTPTWGDSTPQDRPRAWRRGEDGVWITDAQGNWHLVPARNVPPPHPTRGNDTPQWVPNQHQNRQPPAPPRPPQGPPRFPQRPDQMRHDPRQQPRAPQPDPRRFPQQQPPPTGFGPRGFDPNQQHNRPPAPNQGYDPRQQQRFAPNQDQRPPAPPRGPDGRPMPPRPVPQSFGPDPRHATPDHLPQQHEHQRVPEQQQPQVEQPKEAQHTAHGLEWVPLEEQLTAGPGRPFTQTELTLRDRALDLYIQEKMLFKDRSVIRAEVRFFKVGLDGKFIEKPREIPTLERPDRLTPKYLDELAAHVKEYGEPEVAKHTFTPKSDDLPPGRTAEIPHGAYANTVVPVHPSQLHFNTSGNGDRLIHRNEPDFLNKKNALFRRMDHDMRGVFGGDGIRPRGTSGNAEAHITGATKNSIYTSFTDSLDHVINRNPSSEPPSGIKTGYVMTDYVVEAYHPFGIDTDASFHDLGAETPHRENEYLFAGGMPDENIFRVWRLEVEYDANRNVIATRVVDGQINPRFKYLNQMGVR